MCKIYRQMLAYASMNLHYVLTFSPLRWGIRVLPKPNIKIDTHAAVSKFLVFSKSCYITSTIRVFRFKININACAAFSNWDGITETT